MQTATPKSKRKRQSHGGVKYVLTSLSIISTMGLWQHFSNKEALPADQASNTNNDSMSQVNLFQPLPTVINPSEFTNRSGDLQNAQNINSDSSSGLRQVIAPTKQPTAQPRIGIQQVIINSPGGASGGGTIARTGSSR
jgi:hypothetical protein